MVLNSSPSKRPMGGQPKSEASSLSSAEVRRLWEEPTEAIPQNQREAAGILFLLGRGGCQHLPRHKTPLPCWLVPIRATLSSLLVIRWQERVKQAAFLPSGTAMLQSA